MIVALIVVTKLLSVLLSSLDNTGFCSFLAKNYYHDSKDGDFGGKMALLSGLLSIFEETPTNDLLLFPVLIPMMVYAHRTYCLSYLLRYIVPCICICIIGRVCPIKSNIQIYHVVDSFP